MDAEYLLKQYVDSGVPIPEYQFNKLNNNLKKTYIRKRGIAFESGRRPQWYEMPYFPEELKLAAVKQNGNAIQFIENPSEEVQLAAVQQNGYAIEYIKNPSEQVQLAAVQEFGSAIRYIKNPSEQVQLAAVQQNGNAIRHIKNPSEQVQLAAVQESGYAIEYIENPSERVKEYVKGKNRLNENINRIKQLLL
jgi:DNA-dependent RNA polymerase auxiliary subunit epsilon